ncbi:MAG TPA: hypothetical protein VHY22_00180 [Chthoniobacteraceae bacterium]|jgi:hypothetical protein|nr:hypothetical protein [Chthoniobacteraceae bacterium]
MNKRIIPAGAPGDSADDGEWLDIDSLAELEITSDDPEHPIDSALDIHHQGEGEWRASTPGEQLIRILFHKPQSLRRIRLVFEERRVNRTQQFTLRWIPEGLRQTGREIVRQQYNFSPPQTSVEIEDLRVELDQLRALELLIIPDIGGGEAHASLKQIRLSAGPTAL